MPVSALQRGNRVRVVETATGRIARNKSGTPVDGGGHSTKAEASRQVRAINSRMYGKKKRRG